MERHSFLPSIYVCGNFYQVGFDVGRTFQAMIQDFVEKSDYLNDELEPAYNSERGQSIYKETVELLNTKFPYYVQELQGISDGSHVPFFKLMLLHMDSMILSSSSASESKLSGNGCSTIMCNSDDVAIGHTEDAFPAALNHCYIVHADIRHVEDGNVVYEEKFSSLCYAGHLPGFCMNFNKHGFVFTINVIEALHVLPVKTPRHFLTRALLSARNLEEAQNILRDTGTGSAHGFSVNMTFLLQDGPVLFHNVEIGPAENNESQLSIVTVSPGETHVHCNKYLRLKVSEDPDGLCVLSSNSRHWLVSQISSPRTIEHMVEMLSNENDRDFPMYRRGTPKDSVVTISTGIFDCLKKEWRLYTDRAEGNSPIAIFPMVFSSSF